LKSLISKTLIHFNGLFPKQDDKNAQKEQHKSEQMMKEQKHLSGLTKRKIICALVIWV
jgi:hypothetical protein